jgi:small subunit ribosomal protein S35
LGDPCHPSSKKAVLSVSINDLVAKGDKLFHNNNPAQHKFKLLAGERWDENKMMFKISCEKFPTFNMNSKWCSDALDRLIEAALVGRIDNSACKAYEPAYLTLLFIPFFRTLQDTSDPMTDIPLNLRRAEAKKAKRKASIRDIPREWVTGLAKEKMNEIEKE